MQQRKDEILAKKAKLAEIKRQRELRQQESVQRQSGDAAALTAPAAGRPDNREELDTLITQLVGDSQPTSAGPKDTYTTIASKGNLQSSILSTSHTPVDALEPTEQTSITDGAQLSSQSVAGQTLSTAPFSTIYDYAPSPKQDALSYSKAVQTAIEWSPPPQRASDGFSDSEGDLSPSKIRTSGKKKRLTRREREREEELRETLRKEIEGEFKVVKGSLGDDPLNPALQATVDQQKYPARTLTDEELEAVTSSHDFLDFVEKSSKVIERALDQDYDVLTDYALSGISGYDDEEDGYGGSRGKKGRRMKEVAQFWDERWSKRRMISDINFSPKFPELVLASYTKNPSGPQDPDGLIQVWNTHLHGRPEYVFHAASDILTAKFSPFHPNLVLGGAYSGQVLLWDTRSKSSSPVQKTPLTGYSGHTHPVYSLSIVGTQNAHNIISSSTDGVICSWSIDMLSQPQELLTLNVPYGTQRTDELAPTCLAFPPADPTFFLVGAEDSNIYPCHRYERAGAKAGVDHRYLYKGHAAPIMSLAFHPTRGPVDLGDLVLSTSLDWSVKLWRARAPAATSSAAPNPTAGLGGGAKRINALLEFVREDVVYDAKWSPVRPGVFATVDGGGGVEVWDIATETEVPAVRAVPSRNKKHAEGGLREARSLNKVAWEEHEGKKLAVGGLDGVVSIFEVGGELGGAEGARKEEWAAVKKVVSRAEAKGGVPIERGPEIYGVAQ
ncbi:MAG: hypothetical protein M1835_001740 [Candelina submexicana]|nr:MAG: hypothetical protein M1835_001740 [Candelina submexicana]